MEGEEAERILLAEDCTLHANSVARLLRLRFAVDVTSTARDAKALVEREVWSGALFDFMLADGVATTAIAAFRERFPTAPLVVMSGASASDVSAIATAHQAYFLAKPLQNVDWAAIFSRRSVTPRPTPALTLYEVLEARGCTPREAQVAALYSSGKSADEVGVALGISTPTVRSHVKKAYERLGEQNIRALQHTLLHELGGLRRKP